MNKQPYWKAFLLILLTLLILSTGPAAAIGSTASKTTYVSVPASARASYDRLGLRPLLELDYGSFIWLELTTPDYERLAASGVAHTPDLDAGQAQVRDYTLDPVNSPAPILPEAYSTTEAAGAGLHLVKLVGPTQSAWLEMLTASGLRVLQYYPNYTYLVWGELAQTEAAALSSFVSWSQPFLPAYKLSSGVMEAVGPINNLAITFYNSGRTRQILDQISALGGKYIQHFAAQPDEAFFTAIYSFDAANLPSLAGIAEIWAIEISAVTPGLDDEVSAQIVAGNYSGSPAKASPGYFAWLTSQGLDGTGVTWADVDTGLNGTHPDIAGRTVAYVTYAGAPAANTDVDGHGTHTAGTIFGDPRAANGGSGITDAAGFYWGVGIAPKAGMVIQNALIGSAWPPAGGWQQLSKDSLTNGAVGSNNSWYTGVAGAQGYSSAARTHDLMVRDANFDTAAVAEPLIMVFSAGNAGPGVTTITEPKEAKNLIVVGASDNYTRTGTSINGLGSFSSRGPAQDGRILPNVTAPGVSTTSWRGNSGASCSSTVSGPGSAYYTYCTGTSMAAPQVSGAAALIVEWWKNSHGGAVPSPAMVKALLINTAVDMVGGTNVGTNIPNNNQGWGRIHLGNVFTTTLTSQYYDQNATFSNTGEELLYNLVVPDTGKPVKISLVWSDAAGAVAANPALVNNLNLRVSAAAIPTWAMS